MLEKLLRKNFDFEDPNEKIVVAFNSEFYNKKNNIDNRFGRDFKQITIHPTELQSTVSKYFKESDSYICFTPLEGGVRRKENAKGTFIIAQDIDGVPIPSDLPPSYYWETSPDKYQGIWVLDHEIAPEDHELLCRKLSTKYGFDSCGNDIVHLYRIPNTYNNKYKSKFKVGGLQGDGTCYRVKDLEKALKDVKVNLVTIDDEGDIPNIRVDIEEIIATYGLEDDIKPLKGGDRSQWCWRLETRMIRQGASKEEVKFMLLNAPDEMAKFDETTVDQEVHRAFAKTSEGEEEAVIIEPLKKKTRVKDYTETLQKKGVKPPKSLKVVRVDEIEPVDETDFWLIEDVWANNSVGVIGAPPKSFKSILTINLACAIATGQPFDGHKVKQGGVLIVQGENNLAMEQQKIYSITGRTDIPIYFVDELLTLDYIHKVRDVILENNIILLIIDPLYLLFGNGDINKHQDITRRLEALTRLRNKTGVSIMLVHHSRKLERGAKITTADMYGSTFIEGWYESMILLQRSGITTSRMTTYFRNHRSGDVYTLLVDDNMGARMIKDKHDSEFGEVDFKSLKKKEVQEDV